MRHPLDILYNFHWVVPGDAARSAQAHFGFLGSFLERHQIRTLINLRGENPRYGWWRRETQICAAHGIAHIDAMLDSRKLPTRAMLAAIFDAFDAARRPFLLKCSGGQDRTSLAAALYLIHRRGWVGKSEAEAQFARWPYLHFPKAQQRWLKVFVEYAWEESGSQPIADWVRAKYDPQSFAEWLSGRGMRGTFNRVFDKPEASRWQW